ncbi:MAG: zinc dependent phospholipase C family protein, partial [Acetivibrio ethanolgignens]
MRKKSHISVARYLMNSNGMEYLQKHKKSFYLGSILPDCTPSFITRRHSIDETLDILRKEIDKITINYNFEKGLSSYYCRHLGVITHYVADYFTFPHNKIFSGTLKEHCIYEEDLKHAIRNYVKSEEAKRVREKNDIFRTTDEIIAFIKVSHEKYLNTIKETQYDCIYIVELCHRVVDALLQLFELNLPF